MIKRTSIHVIFYIYTR